jgi:release factor glutamine methyltransferase
VTIAELIRLASIRLDRAGSETPRLDAEVLLRHVLNVDRTQLFVRLRESVAPHDAAALDALVSRRISGEPVAFITGTKEFMGLPFAVGPGALIPRPETELLVEWALAWLQERPNATVADVGTGSGAIALSLAILLPEPWHGRIVAADISLQALTWTQRNRSGLLDEQRRDRVALVRGSLLDWCGGPVDLVLANLPYLTPAQIDDNRWLAAEPTLALDGGPDGLDLIKRLITDLPRVLAPGGAVALELDPGQVEAARGLLRHQLPGAVTRVISDLAGLPRHVIATSAVA